MPTDASPDGALSANDRPAVAIPLAGWAERRVEALFALTGKPVPPQMGGAGLLVERAAVNGFRVPGQVSAGGGCRLIAARNGGWVALNLARDDDRTLLPALFCDDRLDPQDDDAIAARVAGSDAGAIVARGREMGLALASLEETPVSPDVTIATIGHSRVIPSGRAPLVIDLSALWAGPLAGHLLRCMGAEVVKIESRTRPDAMRDGDPGLFALVNQGKASVALDLRDPADRAALIALIERADMVIEAARPRALHQLGIDADAIVARAPGLVWITITAHGMAQGTARGRSQGDAANWVGFGDDCSVAGGMSAALREATGTIGFGGDALADPLTGMAAAQIAWRQWASGRGARIILSMAATVRAALDRERHRDAPHFADSLKQWAAARGRPIAHGPARTPTAPVAPLGRDTAQWLGDL